MQYNKQLFTEVLLDFICIYQLARPENFPYFFSFLPLDVFV